MIDSPLVGLMGFDKGTKERCRGALKCVDISFVKKPGTLGLRIADTGLESVHTGGETGNPSHIRPFTARGLEMPLKRVYAF
jgi:hypothetical protein